MTERMNLTALLALSVFLLATPMPLLVAAGEITPSPYWKNQILFPDEPFRAFGTSSYDPGWVKFTILLPPYDPNLVYFQDSKEYAFHYNFASELLDPFLGMTTAQFDAVTLHEQGRQAILGAVIMPANSGWPLPFAYPEYGIQFVGSDPYSRERIVELFEIVKSSIVADPGAQAFYFPAYEQLPTARANRDWFESHGVPVSSADRWAPGNACYSTGWALGELKYVQGQNIASAYTSGLLEPNDILLTDGVPADVPFVAGIISLYPSTPNSHVAILAKTSGVPFVHLALTEDAERAHQLIGRRIVLRAFEEWIGSDIRLIDIEGTLDEQMIEEVLVLKEPPELHISPTAHYGDYSAPTDALMPSDTKYFGGKAANFGILRRAIPGNSPVAAALSFDLWNEFLSQTIASARTLREEIALRLSTHTYPPSNMAALSDDLQYIRSLFTNKYVTAFTQTQRDAVIAVLQDPRYAFDANRKIRFRSSTNVEDSKHFTGAGLYDSYSGCLADDLDGDDAGPSICDPTKTNERGVFRAIRKVFASFYNDNAFLERLRHGVSEADVGMAILVHHSFPDEIELANGVAAMQTSGSGWAIQLVTQLGAVSVTNPEDGSIPEEVDVSYSKWGVNPTLVRTSNLVPLGATILDWREEYIELAELLAAAAREFQAATGKSDYTLDLEYKKVAPHGNLVVKQIRQIPSPENTRTITPLLINEPAEYCTFQGEYGDVFANHRLKSRWLFQTKNLWLTKENLAHCFYADVRLEYNDRGRIRTVAGMLESWPFASHRAEQFGQEDRMNTTDGWLMHHLANRRTCQLDTDYIPAQVSPAENPMLTCLDIDWIRLEVGYDVNVPTWDYLGPRTTDAESISLRPCPKPQQGQLLQERKLQWPKTGVSINTSFYWPPPPRGIVAGYTAPLVSWVETVIEGYTTRPIILHGWYSQTYRPEHHNFGENFIFEPQLEPGLADDILDQLRAKNIRMIYVRRAFAEPEVALYGFDDKPFLAPDLDDDKDVDFGDLERFAGRWLDTACDACGRADLTGDGCVRFDDFQELGLDWSKTVE